MFSCLATTVQNKEQGAVMTETSCAFSCHKVPPVTVKHLCVEVSAFTFRYFTEDAQIIDEQTRVYQFISVFELVVTVATSPLGICTLKVRQNIM